MKKKIILSFLVLFILCGVYCQEDSDKVNLLSLQEETFPIIVSDCYSEWKAELMLNESLNSGWVSATGKINNN